VVLPDISSEKRVLRGFLVCWGEDEMGLSVKLKSGEFRVLEMKRRRVRRFLRKEAMEMENGRGE